MNTDQEIEQSLVEAYLKNNKVTQCPPAYVAPIMGAEPLGPLPYYDDSPNPRKSIELLYIKRRFENAKRKRNSVKLKQKKKHKIKRHTLRV